MASRKQSTISSSKKKCLPRLNQFLLREKYIRNFIFKATWGILVMYLSVLVAQRIERRFAEPKVRGSTPLENA